MCRPGRPATKHPDLVDDLAAEVVGTGLFADPVVVRHPFTVRLTAEEYTANLATRSAVKSPAPQAQRELLDRVRRRLVAAGGRVTLHRHAVLTVAARPGRAGAGGA